MKYSEILHVGSLGDAYVMVKEKMLGWLDAFILMIPNAISALIIFMFFYGLGYLFRRAIVNIFSRTNVSQKAVGVIGKITFYIFVILGVFFCLGVLKLDKTVTSLLAGAGIIGLALSFAFQDLATNFISGFFIALKKPMRVGDLVETNGFVGIVTEIDLRAIHVKTFQGQKVIIPSKDVLQKPITNFVFHGERRLDIEVGVSYGEDLEMTTCVLKDALESIEERDSTREVEVFCDRFGDSSIVMNCRIWLNLAENQSLVKAKHQAVIAIHKSFKAKDITIPFPIRTLDFGIKGGEKLSDVMFSKIKNVN